MIMETDASMESKDLTNVVTGVKDPDSLGGHTIQDDLKEALSPLVDDEEQTLNDDDAAHSVVNVVEEDKDPNELVEPIRYYTKKSLKFETPASSLEPLPEGWVMVAHSSGLPVYLHRQTKVVTWSRPYIVTIEMGGVKKHDVPLSSIPCLEYLKTKENMAQCFKGTSEKTDAGSVSTLKCPVSNGEVSSTNNSTVPETSEHPNSFNKDTTLQQSDGSTVKANGDISSECSRANSADGDGIENQGDTEIPKAILHCAKNQFISEDEFHQYLEKLFVFEMVRVPHFEKWADKRKYNRMRKREAHLARADNEPKKLGPAKVITLTIPKNGSGLDRRQKVVFNTSIKPMVCVLHEYAQSVLRTKPHYSFAMKDNPGEPFEATIVIGEKSYGTATGVNKKTAKNKAALATMEMLVPGFKKQVDDMEEDSSLEYFNDVSVTDPRVYDLCVHSGNFLPYQLLTECLKRNQGIADTTARFEVQIGKAKLIEYKMECGKHTIMGTAKNKKAGKQHAAQQILKLLHPNVKSWGELIRMYGTSVVEKREKKKNIEQEIFKLKQRKDNNKEEAAATLADSDASESEDVAARDDVTSQDEPVTSQGESQRSSKAKDKKEAFVANPELLAKLKDMMSGLEKARRPPTQRERGKRKIEEETGTEEEPDEKRKRLLLIDV